ncbi:MAG: hypothetical protein JOZ72_16905 [Alphaproteobacteria bacterium]|nr:hypothetical protein [Alphaproteobacteria bacterium]
MKIGVAEVGSRSLRLMIADFDADGSFKALRTDSQLHNINIDNIGDADLAALGMQLDAYRDEIEKFECDSTMVYGTALCRRIAQRGMSLRPYLKVLSPAEEATASWAAGFMCLRGRTVGRRITVVDQGGGSTEFISATWSGQGLDAPTLDSIDFGAQKAVDMFLSSSANYLRAFQDAMSSYEDVLRKHRGGSDHILYALGSVATKLAWLKVRENEADFYKPHLVNDTCLELNRIFQERAQILKMYEKDPVRARRYVDSRSGSEDEAPRIIAGSAFLMLIAMRLGYDIIRVSGYGLRHGLAFLEMKRLNPDMADRAQNK